MFELMLSGLSGGISLVKQINSELKKRRAESKQKPVTAPIIEFPDRVKDNVTQQDLDQFQAKLDKFQAYWATGMCFKCA